MHGGSPFSKQYSDQIVIRQEKSTGPEFTCFILMELGLLFVGLNKIG
ncbi:MAG: hypothetical protein OXC57_00935 [Rhodobacteraceae bacterium]|nr:hypothetical protein [Paracoccaceae bacterium]